MRTAMLTLMLCIMLSPCLAVADSSCRPIVVSALTIHEQTAGFHVDVEYPVLCDPRARLVIRDGIQNLISDFKKLHPEHDCTEFPHRYELSGRYAVWPAGNQRFVSVKLAVSVYTGGAHANHWPITWVFDTTDGHPLTLDELFLDLEAGLTALSEISRSVLIDKFGPDNPYDIEPGTDPFEHLFRNFILTNEGVTVFFPPYQVAPYAAGEQVVTIPYNHLNQHLVPEILKTIR